MIVRAVVVLVVGSVLAGCAAQEMDRQRDLNVAISKHHVDLRWGRLPNAATHVHPDLQRAFVEDWAKRFAKIEMTDVDVLQVAHTAEDQAEVVVKFTWIERDTMRVQEHISTERWVREDGRWIAVRIAELPGEGGADPSTAPPPQGP